MPSSTNTSEETIQSQYLDPKIVTSRSLGGVDVVDPVSSGAFAVLLPEGTSESAIDPLPDVVEGETEILVPARIVTITEIAPPASNVWNFDLTTTDALGDPITEGVSYLVEALDGNADLHPVAAARFSIRSGGVGTIPDPDRPRVVVETDSVGTANLQLADIGGAGILCHVIVSLLSPDLAGNANMYTVNF